MPVFFNVPKSSARVEEVTLSRCNPDQNRIVFSQLEDLFRTPGMTVKGSEVAIITPYKANVRHLEKTISSYPEGSEMRKIAVNTPHSFQAREALLVILVLVVDRTTGPVFVTDNRLCVKLSRHSDALWVVGDLQTMTLDNRRPDEFGQLL